MRFQKIEIQALYHAHAFKYLTLFSYFIIAYTLVSESVDKYIHVCILVTNCGNYQLHYKSYQSKRRDRSSGHGEKTGALASYLTVISGYIALQGVFIF